MAQLTGFNAAETPAEMGFSPLPAGTYRAMIVESEQKANKAETGTYLMLKYQIIEGDYKDRYISSFLNLDHPKADVVRMAKGELSCVCHATGILQPTDSQQLHNIPVDLDIKVFKDKHTGEMQNRINKITKAGSAPVTAQAAGNPFAK